MDPMQRAEVIQYGRKHGLFPNILDDAQVEFAFTAFAAYDPRAALEDPQGLPTLAQANIISPAVDKLDLSASARKLLYVAIKQDCAVLQGFLQQFTPRLIRREKLEVPLLKTDTDADLQSLREKSQKALGEDPPFKPWTLDSEKDESLEWPSKLEDLPRRLDQRLKYEKLDLGKGSLRLLSSVLALQIPPDESQRHGLMHTYKKLSLPTCTTPLLSPNLQCLEVDGLVIHDAFTARRVSQSQGSVFNKHLTDPLDAPDEGNRNAHPIPYGSCVGSEGGQSDFDQVPSQCQHLSSDNNATSHGTDTAMDNAEKNKSLSRTLWSISDSEQDDSEDKRTEAGSRASSDCDTVFKEIIESQMLQGCKVGLDNPVDRLSEREAPSPVPVPDLAFTVNVAPWEFSSGSEELHEELRALALPAATMSLHRWPGISKLERSLSWVPPFPTDRATAATRDNFEPVSNVNGLLPGRTELSKAFETSVMKADLPKFHLRSIVGAEAELTPVKSGLSSEPRRQSLWNRQKQSSLQSHSFSMSPPKKRDWSSEDGPSDPSSDSASPKRMTKGTMIFGEAAHMEQDSVPERRPLTPLKSFNVSDELSRFISMQSRRPTPRTNSKTDMHTFMQAHSPPPQKLAPMPIPSQAEQSTSVNTVSQIELPRPPKLVGALPQTLVLSTDLFKNHALLRTVHRLAPNLALGELPLLADTTSRFFEGSTPVTVDVVLPQDRSILLTTLQHTLQKALPGSAQGPQLHRRVRSVAQSGTYRTLHVLVRVDGAACGFVIVGERERRCFEAFRAFCANLRRLCEVNVVGVGTGDGEEAVARWILGLAIGERPG